jgi:hypothetical protein
MKTDSGMSRKPHVTKSKYMKRLLLLMIFTPMMILSGYSQTANPKAMFLYNFSRLIKWPDASCQGDFVFGVLGDQEVFHSLTTIANGKKVGTQNIVIKYFKDPSEISSCHVIYIANSKLNQFNAIVDKLQNRSSLIVTEKKGMINSGSTIDFVITDNKLRYMLSEENARKNNLVLSKNLQDMAMTD